MRFITKAKPVRIRIKSGGLEHSSIQSLRSHYCFEDLISLPSSIFLKWLRQQNDNSVYQKMLDYLHGKDYITPDTVGWKFEEILFNIPESSVVKDEMYFLRYWMDNEYSENVDYYLNSAGREELISLKDQFEESDEMIKDRLARRLFRLGDKETAESLGYRVICNPSEAHHEASDSDFWFSGFNPSASADVVSGWKRLFIKKVDAVIDGQFVSKDELDYMRLTVSEQPYRQFVNYVITVLGAYRSNQVKKHKYPDSWEMMVSSVVAGNRKTLKEALTFIKQECDRLW